MDSFKRSLQNLSLLFLLFSTLVAAQEISFSSSGLANEAINNPTSLDFGPDGRLYVSQQDGAILAFSIIREGGGPGEGTYSATSEEIIDLVQTNTPNHTDDGVATTIKLRQVTGIHTAGSVSNPIIYVTSSDNLIGGGGGINDKNLDTNSGVISKLSWNGNQWTKIDLVRGLPRCEENHSINGMDIFEKDGQTYMLVQQGGHSNKGAPSNNFVGTPEYFLSGALLIINLTQLESMPIYTDPRSNIQYIYDLPTLNDPEREDITNQDPRFPYPSNHPLFGASIDVGDPFGGNDGLNQAFAETGGPVQIFSPGYRNAYDVIVTENGRVYTSDNGPNTGWGGLPFIYDENGVLKGDQSTTSYLPEEGDFIKNEFNETGSSGHGDPLHYVGNIGDAYGTYYAGHPNPILAFPSRANLITYKNIDGEWLETSRYDVEETLSGVSGYFNASFSINNFPDDPRLGNYLSNATSSSEINILDIINSSTNGITEYTASNFDGALKGDILTASFNGNINRYTLNEAGDTVLNKEVIFNGFGATPLDVIALPDGHPFAGTVWAVTYGADNITIFEPSDLDCPGLADPEFDPTADNDGDGYSNQDEIDNSTNFCSGGSTPKDNDGDFLSDLNDSDDDNDSVADVDDVYAIDPDNGTATNLPVNYPFWNNDPGTGFFGLGFTGLMLNSNGSADYLTQFDENNMSFGGAAGKASIDLVPSGDAIGNKNSQQYGFQFGVNVDNTSPIFTIHTRLESPFFGIDGNSTTPQAHQSAGIVVGNGDQDNYLKVVLGHGTSVSDDIDGMEVLLEENQAVSKARYDVPGLLDGNAVDIFINISPSSHVAQPYVSIDGGVNLTALGNPILLPESFLDSSDTAGMAVGLMATSTGSTPFSAIWDFINITEDQSGVVQTSAENNVLNFGNLTLDGDIAQLNFEIKNLSGPADDPLSISDFVITGEDASLFSVTANLPLALGPGGQVILSLAFNPSGAVGEKNANLHITHSGENSPLIISLTAFIEEQFRPFFRINAGGNLVSANDDGPDWLSDILPTNFSVNTGSFAGFDLLFANKHTSIPSYVGEANYEALFANERWDGVASPEMTYSIPLGVGKYEVRLYLGNGYPGTSVTGSRLYDIIIEDSAVVDNLDLVAQFGHLSGGALTFPVDLEDGELNITFVHEIENPLVNAIEILAPPSAIQDLTLLPINDRVDNVGELIDFAVVASGGTVSENYSYSIEGQPDGIQIEPTNGHIFGTILATALDGGIAHDGVHTVSVTVSQTGIPSASQEFIWTVTEEELVWVDKDENENYVARHECSFVQAGKTFIMFGGRESAQQLDIYDYASNTWSQGNSAPVEFNHFQATEYQGVVWVIGAFEDNGYPNESPASHIYMYNPGSNDWIQGIEIPQERRRGGAGLVVHNDKFYILGGNTIGHNGGYVSWFDTYDPASGEWTILSDAPHARDHFHATLVGDKLYAIGGRLSGGDGGVFAPLVAEVDVYDFNSGSWSTLNTNIPTPRAAPGIATFDNKIFVMGGEGSDVGPAYDIVEIFDPTEGVWRVGPSMHYSRHGTQAIVSGGGIYIAGGSPKRGGGNQKNMEVLGKDNPEGFALSASELNTENGDITFTYGAFDGNIDLNFVLRNEVGNIATYIRSVEISGQNFELAENYAHRLIPSQGELTINLVLTETTSDVSNGSVVINYDKDKSIAVNFLGTRNDSETIVYRINTGGSIVGELPLSWSTDLTSNPSLYVNSDDENSIYSNSHDGFLNNTTYLSSLFQSTRYNRFVAPKNMQWTFPVENGNYLVNLLFAEIWAGASEAGVRVFDVAIEDAIVLQDFDMTEKYGWNTSGVESFYVSVSDGNLDVDFIKKIQNPHINAIEIIEID